MWTSWHSKLPSRYFVISKLWYPSCGIEALPYMRSRSAVAAGVGGVPDAIIVVDASSAPAAAAAYQGLTLGPISAQLEHVCPTYNPV